jgi:malonyl-CoA decarboxylase
MRRRLLPQLKLRPHWTGIETDLEHLLASWFNRGFLVLQRIDWRTSAIVLEKLIQYEAVHEIQGWPDLRRRLQADRRCFAFFHPALPDEPIIFIEVALTRGISARVQPLLDVESPVTDPTQANCAIFYSITNCQEGLRGISFGNFLIKQVAEDLGREFPRLKTFSTLSPVPGFRAWLREALPELSASPGGAEPAEQLRLIDEPDWQTRLELTQAIEEPVLRLCAFYLLHAKRDGEPLDAVARFHLGNGARMERLNWLADSSKQGMARSVGIMVNYVYRLDDIEHNHEAYANRHEVVSSARLVVQANHCLLAAARGSRT